MKTLKELLDLVAAGDTNDLTAATRSLLLAHFEARREAAGDSPTAEDADLLDQILDAVEAINTQLSDDESAAAEGDESADGGEQDSSTEPDDSDEQDGDEGDEPAGEQDGTSEPDSEGEQDSTSSDEPAGDEPAGDSAEEGNPPELGDLADVDDRAADLVAAAAKQTDRTDARRRARLTRTRSNGATPTATTPTALPPFVSLGVSTVAPAGSPVDAEQAGQLMRDAVMASRAQPVGTRTPVLRLDLGDKLAVAPKSGSEESYAEALQASLGIATKQFRPRWKNSRSSGRAVRSARAGLHPHPHWRRRRRQVCSVAPRRDDPPAPCVLPARDRGRVCSWAPQARCRHRDRIPGRGRLRRPGRQPHLNGPRRWCAVQVAGDRGLPARARLLRDERDLPGRPVWPVH